MIESEFPSLACLWRSGFERPSNFDELTGQALREWVMVSELPEEVLKANAVLRPAIHPAHPSLESLGQITSFHRQSKMKTPLLYLAATFGYLPLMNDKGATVFGHPWLHHEGARLALDVADRQHVASFTCWRISVVQDLSIDRRTPIVKAYNRRIAN